LTDKFLALKIRDLKETFAQNNLDFAVMINSEGIPQLRTFDKRKIKMYTVLPINPIKTARSTRLYEYVSHTGEIPADYEQVYHDPTCEDLSVASWRNIGNFVLPEKPLQSSDDPHKLSSFVIVYNNSAEVAAEGCGCWFAVMCRKSCSTWCHARICHVDLDLFSLDPDDLFGVHMWSYLVTSSEATASNLSEYLEQRSLYLRDNPSMLERPIPPYQPLLWIRANKKHIPWSSVYAPDGRLLVEEIDRLSGDQVVLEEQKPSSQLTLMRRLSDRDPESVPMLSSLLDYNSSGQVRVSQSLDGKPSSTRSDPGQAPPGKTCPWPTSYRDSIP
jgi:hypothetical protein